MIVICYFTGSRNGLRETELLWPQHCFPNIQGGARTPAVNHCEPKGAAKCWPFSKTFHPALNL